MQVASREYLFVYGTLMCHGGKHELLASHAKFLGEGQYNGRLYRVSYYPGVVPSECPDDWVRGEVFELTAPSVVLQALDAYEECGKACPAPHEYRRERSPIHLGGEIIEAWMYLYNRDVSGLQLIESGRFSNEAVA